MRIELDRSRVSRQTRLGRMDALHFARKLAEDA